MQKFLEQLGRNEINKTEREVKMMAPLVLAYIGDAIFEVFIRDYIVSRHNVNLHELHKMTIKYVKAKSQSEIVHALEERLTEEEWAVVKRGRNQKPATVPKNADLAEYRYATGFETLLGYLFYLGKIERLLEIMTWATEINKV